MENFYTKLPLNWHPLNPMESEQKKDVSPWGVSHASSTCVQCEATTNQPQGGRIHPEIAARVSFVEKNQKLKMFRMFFVKVFVLLFLEDDDDFRYRYIQILICLGVDPRLESPHSSGHLGAILERKRKHLQLFIFEAPRFFGVDVVISLCAGDLRCLVASWRITVRKGTMTLHEGVLFLWKWLALFEFHACYGELMRNLSWHLITWCHNWSRNDWGWFPASVGIMTLTWQLWIWIWMDVYMRQDDRLSRFWWCNQGRRSNQESKKRALK